MNTRLALMMALGSFALVGCPADPSEQVDVPTTDTVTADGGHDALADIASNDVLPPDTGPDATDVLSDTQTSAPTWTLRSLGDSGTLADVFAISDTEAYAVGGERIVRFNGVFWGSFGDVFGASLAGVWANPDVVVVVGDDGLIARRQAGEFEWTVDEVPSSADLKAVYGRAADDLWAVGAKTTILHFDGSTWTEVNAGSTTVLHDVWVSPGSEGPEGVWAVGSNGRLLRTSGGTWVSEQIAQSSVTLNAIWGSGEALFSAGTGGTISMRANAQSVWKGQLSNDPKKRDLHAIAGLSEDELYIVGDNGTIIGYDGDKWSIQSITGPNGVGSPLVAAAYLPGGQDGAWVAISSIGGGLELTAAGWVDLSTRPQVDVRAMAGNEASGLWIVGAKGMVFVETATGWTTLESGTEVDLNDVATTPDGHTWVVGDGGTVLHWNAEGVRVDVNVGVPVALNGVTVNAERVVVCGKGGTLMTSPLSEVIFTPIVSGTPADLQACLWGGDGQLWLAGSFGTLLSMAEGENPVSVSSGVGDTLNTLTATPDGVIVGGDNGVVLAASPDGVTQWSYAEGLVVGGIGIYGLSHAAGKTYAVGWKGSIFQTTDGVLQADDSPTNAVLEAVWTDGNRAIVAGRQGVLLEKTEEE